MFGSWQVECVNCENFSGGISFDADCNEIYEKCINFYHTTDIYKQFWDPLFTYISNIYISIYTINLNKLIDISLLKYKNSKFTNVKQTSSVQNKEQSCLIQFKNNIFWVWQYSELETIH